VFFSELPDRRSGRRAEGIDVFVFDKNGKIPQSRAYRDAGSFVAALTPG